jgi:hypothetical protein
LRRYSFRFLASYTQYDLKTSRSSVKTTPFTDHLKTGNYANRQLPHLQKSTASYRQLPHPLNRQLHKSTTIITPENRRLRKSTAVTIPENRQLRKSTAATPSKSTATQIDSYFTSKSLVTQSTTDRPSPVEPYTPEAQEPTVDVPEVKPVVSIPVPVESSAPRALESTVDAPGVVPVEPTVLKLSTLELSQSTL